MWICFFNIENYANGSYSQSLLSNVGFKIGVRLLFFLFFGKNMQTRKIMQCNFAQNHVRCKRTSLKMCWTNLVRGYLTSLMQKVQFLRSLIGWNQKKFLGHPSTKYLVKQQLQVSYLNLCHAYLTLMCVSNIYH